MGGGGSSRPGKGSRVPKNVKIRPAPAIEERAKPRRNGTGKNAIDNDSDEEEAEEDRIAREQFAQDDGEDQDEDIAREDEQRPLEGMVICSSGQLKLPRENIKAMCEALGALFEQVLTTETTFLVADTTESDKYKACVENGIPVIQSSFILELHHRWLELIPCDVVGLSNYLRLSPLQNLTICLTGYSDDRDGHRNVITQSGGAAYSPELTHEVTHLVVGPNFKNREDLLQNGKYLYAKQINNKRNKRQHHEGEAKKAIWIVWGEWLEHSLYAFGRVKEEPYSTDIVPDRNEIKPPPRERSQDIIQRRNASSPNRKTMKKEQRPKNDKAQIKSKRKLIKQETNHSLDGSEVTMRKRVADDDETKELSISKRAKTEQDSRPSEGSIEIDASILEGESRQEILEPAAVKKQSSALSANPLGPTLDASTSSASLAPRPPMRKARSSTHMELMGVQDLLVTKQEEFSQKQIVASTSSTSSLRAKSDAMTILSEASSSKSASLLSKMGKERSNKFIIKAKESTPGPSESAEASTSKAIHLISKVETPDLDARSASPIPILGAPETTMDATILEEPSLPCSCIFENKRFYITPEDFDGQLCSRMASLMVARGGIQSDCIDNSIDYIICKTISITPMSCDLNDSRLVTADWIEACMAFDEIINDIPLVEAFKKPIRCVLPLPGLVESRICVSYSGFDADYEKPKLVNWLNTLGIPHEPVIRRRDMDGHLRTTHIIIPDQSYRSQRLGTAQEWGIKLVYPQWIREQALQHPVRVNVDKEVSHKPKQYVKSEEIDKFQDPLPSSDDSNDEMKPLKDCRVHVPRKLQDWRDLEKLAVKLGARTIQNFDNEMAKTATHLLFQSSQTKPTGKDFVLALQNKVKIVHPDWLRHTAEKGVKQAEVSYKHTRNSKRGLAVAVESPGMARVSSSSSDRPVRNAPVSDEYDLPPPLKKSSSMPSHSNQAFEKSMPRSIRSPQPPPSPPRHQAGLSYTAPSTSTPERSQTIMDDIDQNQADISHAQQKADDSGFVMSAGKEKSKAANTPSLATSSEPVLSTEATKDTPSAKDKIMAEMQALMQVNDLTPQQLGVRLPFQQQGGYQSRTSLRKSIGRVGESASPNASFRPTSSTIEGSALARRQAFTHYDETQFGLHRNEETQTQAMLDEQTMVIKINDPVAEARKAKTLAEIRRAKSGESSGDITEDAEATQRSTEETMKSTSRRSRNGNPANRRRD